MQTFFFFIFFVYVVDRNTTPGVIHENIPVLLIIPAQLRIIYSEYVSISWTDFLRAVELSMRVSKNAWAVSGDASWCSSAAVYIAAMEARLAYQAIWKDRNFKTRAYKKGGRATYMKRLVMDRATGFVGDSRRVLNCRQGIQRWDAIVRRNEKGKRL